MADSKISTLPSATTPLGGTEVLPIVQSGTTDKITVNNFAAGNLKSQSTTGVLQVAGPTAATTRVMTIPDANFTAARTDAAQQFSAGSGVNIFDGTGTEIAAFSKSGGDRMYIRIAGTTDESLSFVNASGTAVATVNKTGDFSLPNGNFVPNTAAKGIVNTTAQTVASSGTVNFSNFAGMILVNNVSSGGVALWICGGGSTLRIATIGSNAGNTLAYSSGINGYVWTNDTGGSADFTFLPFQTRNAA